MTDDELTLTADAVGTAGPGAVRNGMSVRALAGAVRRPEARRTMWSILDQAASSIGNLALSVLVARYSTPREFGAFGLAFATYLLMLGASRGLCSLPLTLRFSAADDAERRHAARCSVGLSAAFGCLLAFPVLVVGLMVHGVMRQGLLPLALITPALLVQDSWRYAFFAMAIPIQSMWNDLVWTGAQLVLFGGLIATGHATVSALFLTWGFGAAVAAAFGVVQSKLWPTVRGGLLWLRAQRDIAPSLTLESIAVSGSSQLTLFCVAAAGGLTSVAALRAAGVVLGPIATLFTGVVFALAPEAVRLHRRAPERLVQFTTGAAIALATIAAIGGCASLLIPAHIGRALLGDNWAIGRPLFLPLTLGLAATGALIGAMVGMRVLLAAKQTLVIRLVLLGSSMLAGSVGVLVGGAAGAQLGMSLAGCAVTVLAWVWFRRLLASSRTMTGANA